MLVDILRSKRNNTRSQIDSFPLRNEEQTRHRLLGTKNFHAILSIIIIVSRSDIILYVQDAKLKITV